MEFLLNAFFVGEAPQPAPLKLPKSPLPLKGYEVFLVGWMMPN